MEGLWLGVTDNYRGSRKKQLVVGPGSRLTTLFRGQTSWVREIEFESGRRLEIEYYRWRCNSTTLQILFKWRECCELASGQEKEEMCPRLYHQDTTLLSFHCHLLTCCPKSFDLQQDKEMDQEMNEWWTNFFFFFPKGIVHHHSFSFL